MRKFKIILGEIWRGKSLLRAYTNLNVEGWMLHGKVIDIGGGKDPSYLRFMKKEGADVTSVDFKVPGGKDIDLEKDPLPYKDATADYVLMFNILEHLYNYSFALREAKRILKPDGKLYGFVPFLIHYHPDPHDYFRYTKEALEKIFKETGFIIESIQEVGAGPFSANFNNLMFAFPVIFRVPLFPFYYILDHMILKLKPHLKERYPLGYSFVLKKS